MSVGYILPVSVPPTTLGHLNILISATKYVLGGVEACSAATANLNNSI